MLGDTTEMKLDDWWRDLIPPDELAVQPPMMPEQPFNMNGNMQFGNSMLRQQNNPYNPYCKIPYHLLLLQLQKEYT